MECYDDLLDDPMTAWKYGGCYKGKVYPFVPMENYTSPSGDKLYCDCKYAILTEVNNLKSAAGFMKLMRSLRWMFLKVRAYEPLGTIRTNPNMRVVQMELHRE